MTIIAFLHQVLSITPRDEKKFTHGQPISHNAVLAQYTTIFFQLAFCRGLTGWYGNLKERMLLYKHASFSSSGSLSP